MSSALTRAPVVVGSKHNDVRRRRLLLIRGIFGFGAIGGFLWAVQLLPLNDAQVLSFTAPIWAALLSPLLLGERPSRWVLDPVIAVAGSSSLIVMCSHSKM